MYFKKLFLAFGLFTSYAFLQAKDSIDINSYLKNRLDINTISQDKSNQAYKIQQNRFSSKNKKTRELIQKNVNDGFEKTHGFAGIGLGITQVGSLDIQEALPSISASIGYQNFLGIFSNYIGIRSYINLLFGTNVFNKYCGEGKSSSFFGSCSFNPKVNVLEASKTLNAQDTTLVDTSINADIIFEAPISVNMMSNISLGYGIGYMIYNDVNWDTLQGFSVSLRLKASLTFFRHHTLSLESGTIFYNYGIYVTRRIQTNDALLSSQFRKPQSFLLGYSYVF